MLINRANLLDLSAPEMTALTCGMRAMGVNWYASDHGVFTGRSGVSINHFLANLYDKTSRINSYLC